MTTPSSTLKRKDPPLVHEGTPAKKARIDDAVSLVSRLFVQVSWDRDYERASRNIVHLSPKTYKELFKEEAGGHLVKISNLVFEAIIDPSLKTSQMDINFMVHDQIEGDLIKVNDQHGIWITPYNKTTDTTAPINTLHLRVIPAGTLQVNGLNNHPQALLTDNLIMLVKELLADQIFSLKQQIFFKHPVIGPLELRVERWDLDWEDDEIDSGSGPFYGKLDLSTAITFSSGNTRTLTLVDEVHPSTIDTFQFTITRVEAIAGKVFSSAQQTTSSKESWKDGVDPLPMIVPFQRLTSDLRKRLTNQTLVLGRTEIFSKGRDWKYTVELDKVKIKESEEESMDIEEEEVINQKAFRLTNDHSIQIVGHSQVLLSKQLKDAKTASELTFEIVDMKNEYDLEENEIPWISAQEVTDKVRQITKKMAIKGHVVIELKDRKYLLLLKKASGFHIEPRSTLKTLWLAGPNTDVKVFAKGSLKLEIVDTADPMALETLTLKVSTPSSRGGGLLALLTGGSDQEGDKTIVTEEELRKIFKDAMPTDSILHDKQTLTGITGKGEKVEFKIDKVHPSGKKEYYGHIYKYLPDTTIKFEGEKGGGLLITSKTQEINFENIHQKLIEFGIGGMSEQFKDVISRTILSRGTYSDHIKEIGQKPSRGMLLYGPPGTGKTLLARSIGEILGVSKERIKLYTGSQVWSKYVGESEKKVREMFADARADQKRYGKDSPLHLLILDEIDAFLKDRSTAERRYEVSVVNTFIAELDGIASEGEDSLDNIIVIGLTNHPDGIDEAAKRPGRLYPHINIGIPDSKGREEIFNIHTKSIRQKGLIADDVDVAKVVQMTVGKTGAFIEGLVVAAAEYSLKRLWVDKVPGDEIREYPGAKITMSDLKKAYEECAKAKTKAKAVTFTPSKDIQPEGIAEDLRKLRLGGLSNDVLRFLSDLKLAQLHQNHLYTTKSGFPRGALLYGLPGAGKTSLSKAVRQLFGLDGQRYQYYKASDLWPMAGSKLKEKMEAMMQPAIDAAKDLKGEAPLHVIVIDEIDMIYYNKKQTDNDLQSVMNQFLLELDALFDDELHPVHNLLVLGIAHRPFNGLPEGILRHGRLGKHVEMKYPDWKGRKEVFEIHLKEFIDKKMIEGELNWKELVELTKDRSGAYIEGLINEAAISALRRDPKGNLSMQDFRNAHDAIKYIEPWKGYIV